MRPSSDLAAIARVTTTVTGGTDNKERSSGRHFITSLNSADDIARAVRSHWGIENGLHWQLDVVFREDDCRVRLKHLAKNLNAIRRWVLNTLKRAFPGESLAKHRRLAGWNDDHFIKIANLFAQDTSL